MENTAYLIMKASRVLKYELDQRLKKYDITASQFSVLYQIRQHNNRVTASEVAEVLDLDRPTISAIIKRLHNKGIIERVPHEKDKRSEYLLINNGYLAVVDMLRQESDMLNTEMFNAYTQNQLNVIHSVLSDIVKKA